MKRGDERRETEANEGNGSNLAREENLKLDLQNTRRERRSTGNSMIPTILRTNLAVSISIEASHGIFAEET